MKQLDGKVAVVTGAAMGIGKLIAQDLLREGCRVAMVDINQNTLKQAHREIPNNAKAAIYTCDISDKAAVTDLAENIRADLGPVSILINNAGIVKAGELLDLEDEIIRKTIDVNLTAMFWTTKAFLPEMISRNEGHIVNMASAGGILAIPNLSAYCASKFGVIGFTDAIRQEMKKKKRNIGLTFVCPNTVGTGMFNGAKMVTGTRLLQPQIVSKKVIKAIKKNKSMLAIPSIPVKFMTPLSKLILPIGLMDQLNRFLGMWHANDTWKGRTA